MSKLPILNFINPVQLFKAYQYHRNAPKYDKSKNDLELMLYAQILTNDMLHFGYFEDINISPDAISVSHVEAAQMNYAKLLSDYILNTSGLVLDVGCGMGGLSNMLTQKGLKVQALTPNITQKRYIEQKHPLIQVHHTKYEDFATTQKFETIINSESLQYINLDQAFNKTNELLHSGGRWLITDFFRTKDNTIHKSGHRLNDFLDKTKLYQWKIVHEQDISLNALPTLKVVDFYCKRFLEPLAFYASEKLRYKQAWLYYLLQDSKEKIQLKIDKELASIDPEKFLDEKKYMFYVLEKK